MSLLNSGKDKTPVTRQEGCIKYYVVVEIITLVEPTKI